MLEPVASPARVSVHSSHGQQLAELSVIDSNGEQVFLLEPGALLSLLAQSARVLRELT